MIKKGRSERMSWLIEGLVWSLFHIVPVIIGLIIFGIGFMNYKKISTNIILLILGLGLIIFGGIIGGDYLWHETYDVSTVQEKIITVQEWQPSPNIQPNENGLISITSVNDLILLTSDGEFYKNTEDIWFSKFETRNIFNKLKVNGTYKIKYYGWRNGYNNGFPNILSVEQVINENNTKPNNYYDYLGTRWGNEFK